MTRAQELDLQWQALRFAVDQIDIAWSAVHAEDYGFATTLYDQKRDEMMVHRERLVRMTDDILAQKYEAEK
jgi:hypothetical protein